MTEHTSKAVVLLSGGIDSAVCLQQALDEYEEVEAIHFEYGQQTESIERSNAEAQATAHNIDLHTVDYRTVFGEFAEGTIEDKEYDSNHMAEEGHSVGYVPQRNLHFLTSAAAVAEHHTDPGVELVLFHGAQYNDSTDYPDCRPAFIEVAQKAINRSTDQHTVAIETPLIDLDKPEVLALGEELGVDWSLTFSCYNDQSGTPCGECPACVERKEAFEKADIEDPVVAQ